MKWNKSKYYTAKFVIYICAYSRQIPQEHVHLLWHGRYTKFCNLYHLFQHGNVEDMNKYGNAIIYAVHFNVAWFMTWTNMEALVSFLVFSVVGWWHESYMGNLLVWGLLQLIPVRHVPIFQKLVNSYICATEGNV